MTRKPALTRGGAVLLVLVISAITLVSFGAGCSQSITVDGRPLDRAAMDAEIARRLSVMEKKSPSDLKGKRGEKLERQTGRQVATEMIKDSLIAAQAAALSVKLAPDEVNRRLEEARAKVGAAKFAKDLKSQGLSEQTYMSRLEGEALLEALAAKITADAHVSDDEAESFYLTHRSLFARSQMAHMLQIQVDTEGQAKAVLDQLRSGQNFSTLASAISLDTSTRLNGGDMGWVEMGTRDPEFEKAAFAVPTGQISGIIKAGDGYHIVKVVDRREAYMPAFSEVKARAFEDALNDKKKELFSDWLRTLYANAEVTVPSSIGVWDPALGAVVEKSGAGR